MAYYFADQSLHFVYKKNQRETAEHLMRSARSLAEDRFKKKEINQLNISNHQSKLIRANKGKTSEKDVLMSTLITMHKLSENKALAVSKKYQRLGDLRVAYESLTVSEGELLLADLTPPNSIRDLDQH